MLGCRVLGGAAAVASGATAAPHPSQHSISLQNLSSGGVLFSPCIAPELLLDFCSKSGQKSQFHAVLFLPSMNVGLLRALLNQYSEIYTGPVFTLHTNAVPLTLPPLLSEAVSQLHILIYFS